MASNKANKKVEEDESQGDNPFNQWKDGSSHLQKLQGKDEENYGRPVEGSKADTRGKKATDLINSEMLTLCEMIWQNGLQDEDGNGTACITFGDLFQLYTRISSKVVGILMRARKHGLLHFKGEMLFQGRDDNVLVFLIQPIQEIYRVAGKKQPEATKVKET